jgi:copper oxidase (laccase) domain-containing protein
MGVPASDLVAYIGPGIGPRRYEVGENVRQAFVRSSPEAEAAFVFRHGGKYLADLAKLARQRLSAAGIGEVHSANLCTASDERFFSFRRDRVTGRMASLIWLEGD